MNIHKKLFIINLIFGALAIISWCVVLVIHSNVYWPWIFNIAQFTVLAIQWLKILQQRKSMRNGKY